MYSWTSTTEIIVSEPQSGSKTIELWIRSFAPVTTGPTQERALERVESLEKSDLIDTVDIGVWGKEIEQTERSRRIPQLRKIQARLESFEQWARRTDHSLAPFFRTRNVESKITGDRYEVQRLPTIALAEFEDDELIHVAPCRDGERTIDVFDRLDVLEDERKTNPVVTFEEDSQNDDEISDQTGTTAGSAHRFVGPSSTGSN